jgi:hypothetical protein
MPKIVSRFSPDIPPPPASTWIKPEIDAGNDVIASGAAIGQQVEITLDAAGATFGVNVNSNGSEIFLQDAGARIQSSGSINMIAPDFSTSNDAEIGNNANVVGRLRIGTNAAPRLTFPDGASIPNFSDPRALVFQNNTSQADLRSWPFQVSGYLAGSAYELGVYELRTTAPAISYNPGQVGNSSGPTPTDLAGLAANPLVFHRDNVAGTDRRLVLGEIKTGDLILAARPSAVVEWLVFRATNIFQAFGAAYFGPIETLLGANAPIAVGDQIRFYVFSISTV